MNIIINTDCTGTGPIDLKLDSYIAKNVLPYYANTHSDAMCSEIMATMIEESRRIIKEQCGVGEDYGLIFTGQGMTGAARHLAHMINGIDYIIYSILEHVSNSSLWETLYPQAKVNVIGVEEFNRFVIDKNKLSFEIQSVLENHSKTKKHSVLFIALTACSNVVGCIQPIHLLTDMIASFRKQAMLLGVTIITCIDCAACAPYIPLHNICHGNDAILISPHKFKGGYSTPGVLLVKKEIMNRTVCPFFPGGGTVWYKDSSVCNKFLLDVEHREEGGTPNIIGIIRTGLIFTCKLQKQRYILQKNKQIVRYVDKFFKRILHEQPHLHMYTPIGKYQRKRLPIYSFHIHNTHPGLFVKILSDEYGIQTRSGVSCCYMLAEHLCRVNKHTRKFILSGKGTPNNYGWVRVSFHYDFTIDEINYTLEALQQVIHNMQTDMYDAYLKRYIHSNTNNKWYKYNEDKKILNIVKNVFANVSSGI